mmetsp:Transcript_4205/g.11108  ORF Transcript_4205/g.11108 Transcript_4205/m.11108 type:complete len:134 (-) Transcript_4205:534-935(-)
MADTSIPDGLASTASLCYAETQVLGQGGSGLVLLGSRCGVAVAIKAVDPPRSLPPPLPPGAMGTVSHPHLVEVIDVVQQHPEGVLEVRSLCEGGELFDMVAEDGQLEFARGSFFFVQMMEALAHCHERGVASG